MQIRKRKAQNHHTSRQVIREIQTLREFRTNHRKEQRTVIILFCIASRQ
jgi:hypothetical protein